MSRVDPERVDRLKKSPSAFRTISEVADDLHIPQHVLRFWETRFPQVKPLKRGGGRRYYRPDDITLLRRISELLYIQGYTIKGVQRLLREGDGTLLDVPPPDLVDGEERVRDDLDAGSDPVGVPPTPAVEHGGGSETLAPDGDWFAIEEAPPGTGGGERPVAAADGGTDPFRILLLDVLDELRLLRGQISA